MIKIGLRRSLLFVPANRPELFDKALAGPADMICIELEDGVGPDHKDLARENMLKLLAGLYANNTGKIGTQAEILVRINHPETAAGEGDLSAFLSLQTRSVGLMLPKISTADELRSVEHHLQAHGFDGSLFLLIETNQGLEECKSSHTNGEQQSKEKFAFCILKDEEKQGNGVEPFSEHRYDGSNPQSSKLTILTNQL